jgi:hypothetical protein
MKSHKSVRNPEAKVIVLPLRSAATLLILILNATGVHRYAGVMMVLALATFWSTAGHATPIVDWSLTLTEPQQAGPPGTTLVYNGVITNFTGEEIVLGIIAVGFSANPPPASTYVIDFTDEFLDTLGIIPASGYNGSILFVEWLAAAPVGLTSTAMVLLWTEDAPDAEPLSAEFSARVAPLAPVPESGTALFVIAGLLVAAGRISFARRRAVARLGRNS